MVATLRMAGMNASRVRLVPTGTGVGHVLVIVAALAGLFSMHGLSDHGMGMPDAAVALEGSMSMSHGSHAMTVADETPGAVAGSSEPPGEPPMQDDHGMGLMGLCLTVLVAALSVGLSMWRRGARPLRSWLPRWRPVRLTLALAGPLRPPDLLALSIQRC